MLGYLFYALLGIVIIIPIGIVWLSLSLTTKLQILGIITPLQLYVADSFPPISQILTLVVIIQYGFHKTKLNVLSMISLGLAVVSTISMFWSPVPGNASATIVYFVAIAGMVAVGARIVKNGNIESVLAMANAWLLSALCEAVLVIIFRWLPDLELAYLHATIAGIFANSSVTKALFNGSPNNVLDVDKSGGLFVNANAASAFLGVALLVCLALFYYKINNEPIRHYQIMAPIFLVAIVCTGSKSGIVIAGIVIFILLLWGIKKNRYIIAAIPLLPIILVWATAIIVDLFGTEGVLGSTSTTTRFFLWENAIALIEKSPWLGLGFGGWSQSMASYFGYIGSSSNYPPHNYLLDIWMNIGILGPALVLIFLALSLKKISWNIQSQRMIGIALMWTFVHSLFDNTQLLLSWAAMPVLALVIGAITTRSICGTETDWSKSLCGNMALLTSGGGRARRVMVGG